MQKRFGQVAQMDEVQLGSISSTFYEQLLRAQIPNAQKRLTILLSFLRFQDLHA